MPAFNATLSSEIVTNIRRLFHRRSHVAKLHLSREEYIRTFVPWEARDLFRDIGPHMVKNYQNSRFTLPVMQGDSPVETVTVILQHHGDISTPTPRTMAIQDDAPKEVVDRIFEWLANGGDVSRDFGRVVNVFAKLNAELNSRVAMRYYWPTLLALCSESDKTKGIGKELQELRTPTALKQLPSGLAKACRQTAETIATARLLPEDATAPVYSEGVTIGVVTGQKYEEEFGSFYGES